MKDKMLLVFEHNSYVEEQMKLFLLASGSKIRTMNESY